MTIIEKTLCSIYTALIHQYHTYSAITQPIITSFVAQEAISSKAPTWVYIPYQLILWLTSWGYQEVGHLLPGGYNISSRKHISPRKQVMKS